MEDKAFLKIAKALVLLKNSSAYNEIKENDFKKAPSLTGYFVDFSNAFNKDIYLILNNSKKFKIEKNTKQIEEHYFVVLNLFDMAEDLNSFLKDIDKYSKIILELLEKLIKEFNIELEPTKNEKDNQYNLPYGYTRDNKGNVVVDKKEADLVRRIFMQYSKQKSMKKVAEAMRSSGFVSRKGERIEFGVVSDILHDSRYLAEDLPQAIVPVSLFKKVQDILKRNTKENRTIKYY